MLKTTISADEAKFGKKMFDSELKLVPGQYSGSKVPHLFVKLRVHLNFLDRASPKLDGVIVNHNGTNVAVDADDWRFPLGSWGLETDRYAQRFMLQSEEFWDGKFLLHPPRGFQEFQNAVRCRFRLELVMEKRLAHNRVNAIKLAEGTQTLTHSKKGTRQINVGDQFSFRSHASLFDSLDFIQGSGFTTNTAPKTSKVPNIVLVRTHMIAHEVGHMIGQAHIAGLKGNKKCTLTAATQGEKPCYGTGLDATNIMGSGDQLSDDNAITWRERLAEHTGTRAADWRIQRIFVSTYDKANEAEEVIKALSS